MVSEDNRWLAGLRGLFFAITIAGFAWGLRGLVRPDAVTSSPASETVMTPSATPETSFSYSLPKSWSLPTRVPLPSATPTALPTPTPTQQALATAAPSATSTLTPLPTISPTFTPIHRPADGLPTRITAPAIGLDAKVVLVRVKEQYEKGVLRRTWVAADYAAGFHQGTALPGHVGNTVISGHNNIRGEVFRDLHKLRPGDEVLVWVGDNPYSYRVAFMYRLPIKDAPPEILNDNLQWIQPTDDQRLTLITCWPPWSNTHRTIIVAFPAP